MLQVLFIILDKPGPPVGPLEVTDVHKEICTLLWNKPKDEGGLPITGELFAKMDTTTRKWVHAGFVDPTKTEHKINDLEPNRKYHFKVEALNEEGESEPYDSDAKIVPKNPYDTPGPLGLPKVTDYDKNMVELKWDAPFKDGRAPITGYIIEMKSR